MNRRTFLCVAGACLLPAVPILARRKVKPTWVRMNAMDANKFHAIDPLIPDRGEVKVFFNGKGTTALNVGVCDFHTGEGWIESACFVSGKWRPIRAYGTIRSNIDPDRFHRAREILLVNGWKPYGQS